MNSETQRGTSPTRGRKTTVALLILCLSLQAIGMGSLSLFLPVIIFFSTFSTGSAGFSASLVSTGFSTTSTFSSSLKKEIPLFFDS